VTLQDQFQTAVLHHQSGRLAEAEYLYRQVLSQDPNHPDALHLLGVIAAQAGDLDAAVHLIQRATTICCTNASYFSNLGNALKIKGKLDESIAACRQAIQIKPDFADAYTNLANALSANGALDEAIAAYRRAIQLNPDRPETHCSLGNALKDKGLPDESIASYRVAIRLKPDYAEAHNNLGNTLADKQRLDEAIACYRQSIRLKPDYAEAYNNLGIVLQDHGQLDEAIASHQRAIALRPDFAEAHHDLGVALWEQGRPSDAAAAHRRAISLKPTYAEAHFNLAGLLLANGDFSQGWQEYEWRRKCRDFPSPPWKHPQPQWDGGPLGNRAIVLHTEQGFGDAIQFFRYVPLVAQCGGKIIISSQPQLQRLFQTQGYQVISWTHALPKFDLHCPLLSLPRIYTPTPVEIPSAVPYLRADAKDAAMWRQRLADQSKARIGLVWAARPLLNNLRKRSMNLAKLAPLLRTSAARFFSLQKGEAAAQAKTLPPALELTDWTDDLTDFADTTALIANLDLIITVDTAVAHLAGAMAKPVWTLLPFHPEWRWLLQPERTPWYPTMRLFRQPSDEDWDSVIAHVAEELAIWIATQP
jgi:tetratricopeptide (TPR) repeat protein